MPYRYKAQTKTLVFSLLRRIARGDFSQPMPPRHKGVNYVVLHEENVQ